MTAPLAMRTWVQTVDRCVNDGRPMLVLAQDDERLIGALILGRAGRVGDQQWPAGRHAYFGMHPSHRPELLRAMGGFPALAIQSRWKGDHMETCGTLKL